MPSRVSSTDSDGLTLDSFIDRGWLSRNFGHISQGSVAKQVSVGGVSGWCAGYVFSKVGRVAAMTLGGSLVLLQVANHKGIIEINWNKVNKNINDVKKKVSKDADKMLPYLVQEVCDFAKENAILASGFAGGFLIGLAC